MAADGMRAPILEGKDAKEFLEYMSRPLSIEEKESLSEAYNFYKKQSKN